MRCTICNKCLTDYEATRKHKETGEFLDLCSPCFSSVASMASFETIDRPELLREFDIDQEDCGDFMDSPSGIEYNDYQGDTSEH